MSRPQYVKTCLRKVLISFDEIIFYFTEREVKLKVIIKTMASGRGTLLEQQAEAARERRCPGGH